MGDPKKLKKKYSTPVHPWNKVAIDSERIIVKDYALKNKKEIFIANSVLKKYKNIAKRLIAVKTVQNEKEQEQILKKLRDLGLISADADLDTVLGLELKDVMERRLQSIIFRKGLSRSMKQARQFIVHRHIVVSEKELSMPSYLVSLQEEGLISFKQKSSLSDEEHPERLIVKKKQEKSEKIEKEVKKEVKKKKTVKLEGEREDLSKNLPENSPEEKVESKEPTSESEKKSNEEEK